MKNKKDNWVLVVFILTFIYCTMQISSRVSMEENEDKNI